MKYTKIPANAFKEVQLNAGVLLSEFNPSSAAVAEDNIIGATTGGVNFDATPTFIDFGEDIDNCPKNTKELKKLDSWEVKMTGTFVALNEQLAKLLAGAADSATGKITPRNDVLADDYKDMWWVGDYSDKNGDNNGGYVAIHLINALSTGGFKLQSTDKNKGQFAFEFTGHYSMANPNTVPYEVYLKAGTDET